MEQKDNLPKYMLLYTCAECGQESGYTELEEPVCRYCDHLTKMTLTSKQEITAEVMQERLRELTDNMMKNLQLAFESMTDEDRAAFSAEDKDAEKEMLELLAKTKDLRDKIHDLELKEPEEKDKEV